jgi:hypothetical protein
MSDEMGWASNVIDPEVFQEWIDALNRAGMTFALKSLMSACLSRCP